MENPDFDLPTQIYDRDGRLITEFYAKRRILIPIDRVPDIMIKALLAAEDSDFYEHFGIDPIRMVKALIVDIIAMDYVQGASTLTQQTAKLFLLSSEKKMIRKLKEILLAFKIETQFSKDQILELYLNKTYFGHGAYGIETAAHVYFSKSVEELNLSEAALLAGLPQAPSKYAPTANITRATWKRNLVLKRMEEEGFITKEEKFKAIASPIALKLDTTINNNETSYFIEHIRRYLQEKYGNDELYRGGMKVHTTMNLKLQILAQNALEKGIIDHDKRQGYRGPSGNLLKEINEELNLDVYSARFGWSQNKFKALALDVKEVTSEEYKKKYNAITGKNHFIINGIVHGVVNKVRRRQADIDLGKYTGKIMLNAIRWARPVDYGHSLNWNTKLKNLHYILKPGDVVELKILDYNQNIHEMILELNQKPLANGAIFVMNPLSGHVLAMSGGFDFLESEYNRAIQSKRQPGSAFKPIIYSLALSSGFTTSSILMDSPLNFDNSNWQPQNYSKKFSGGISLRNALVHSKNVPTIRLTESIGVDRIIQHAKKLGITAQLPENLTICLGSASVTLEEMVRTYNIFASGGRLILPKYILRIEDKNGHTLYEDTENTHEQVLTEATAFLVTSILKDVIKRGSGWRAKAINRPAAGKTGTTNNYVDAWFIGYIPQLITGVYVGFDKGQKTLGHDETGSRAAAPIWTSFMKDASESLAILPFKNPDNIKIIRINPKTAKLDCDNIKNTLYEYFVTGTEPKRCQQDLSTQTALEEL